MQGSKLIGDIAAYQLVVDEGSNFEGRCKMTEAPLAARVKHPIQNAKKIISKPRKQIRDASNYIVSNPLLKKISILGCAGLILIGFIIFGSSKGSVETQIKNGYRLIQEDHFGEAEAEFKADNEARLRQVEKKLTKQEKGNEVRIRNMNSKPPF